MLALGFSSCEDTSDLGKMQVNPQESVMEADGLSISYLDRFAASTVDMTGLEGTEMNLISWQTVDYTLPEDASVLFRLRVATNENFSDEIILPTAYSESDASVVLVSADAINDAIISLYGRVPVARDLWIAIESYIIQGSELSLVSNELGKKKISVTPFLDPAYAGIESAYYFMSSANGMTVAGAQKMIHSDKHQFDDPLFSFVLEITDAELASGNFEWMIVPESVFTAGGSASECLGVAVGTAADTLKGDLVEGGQPGELTAASKYLITVDMLNMTYTISYSADQFYVWYAGVKADSEYLLTTDNGVNFSGCAVINGASWKLRAEQNFTSLQMGAGAEEGTLAAGSATKPIIIKEKGLYWVDVNVAALTYSLDHVATLGLCGTMTDWADGADIEMTPNDDWSVWTATDVVFAEAGIFKIRANGTWDGFNLGGDLDNLNYDGSDIPCEAGTYDVVLTLGADHVYSVKITKK